MSFLCPVSCSSARSSWPGCAARTHKEAEVGTTSEKSETLSLVPEEPRVARPDGIETWVPGVERRQWERLCRWQQWWWPQSGQWSGEREIAMWQTQFSQTLLCCQTAENPSKQLAPSSTSAWLPTIPRTPGPIAPDCPSSSRSASSRRRSGSSLAAASGLSDAGETRRTAPEEAQCRTISQVSRPPTLGSARRPGRTGGERRDLWEPGGCSMPHGCSWSRVSSSASWSSFLSHTAWRELGRSVDKITQDTVFPNLCSLRNINSVLWIMWINTYIPIYINMYNYIPYSGKHSREKTFTDDSATAKMQRCSPSTFSRYMVYWLSIYMHVHQTW